MGEPGRTAAVLCAAGAAVECILFASGEPFFCASRFAPPRVGSPAMNAAGTLSAWFSALSARFSALSVREKAVLAAGLLCIVAFIAAKWVVMLARAEYARNRAAAPLDEKTAGGVGE